MKEYVIQSKNGMYVKCERERKELDDWDFCKNDYVWNPNKCDSESNKACKIDEYLHIKNCSCGKCLIGKSILEREDEY